MSLFFGRKSHFRDDLIDRLSQRQLSIVDGEVSLRFACKSIFVGSLQGWREEEGGGGGGRKEGRE